MKNPCLSCPDFQAGKAASGECNNGCGICEKFLDYQYQMISEHIVQAVEKRLERRQTQ